MPSLITAGGVSDYLSQTGGADGALTLQTGPTGAKVDAIALASDGTATFLKQPKFPVQSMIMVNTANGFGSTDTRIRRFANITHGVNGCIIQGTDITIADSAANATRFTCVTSGIYSITYTLDWNPSGLGGISLNSTELTTDLDAVTNIGTRLAMSSSANTSPTCVCWTGYIAAGGIIRPHANATGAFTNSRNHFTIVKVA